MQIERTDKQLSIVFAVSISLMIAMAALFPACRLTFMAPWLILYFYRKTHIAALWAALGCGLIVDLLAANSHFGLYAINYCMTTWILYGQKRNFFQDHLSTLPIMTYLFSMTSTGIQVMLLYIFDNGLPMSWEWIATDIIVMPLCDAAYAFVCFALPFRKTNHPDAETASN